MSVLIIIHLLPENHDRAGDEPAGSGDPAAGNGLSD